MALIGIFTRNRALRDQIRGALEPLHGVVDAPTWDVFLRTVRERPVGGLLVHLGEEGMGSRSTIAPLLDVRRRFPSIGLIPVLDDTRNPQTLFGKRRLTSSRGAMVNSRRSFFIGFLICKVSSRG